MSGDYSNLASLPGSLSLTSQLQSLDLLASRLRSLSTKAEWESKLPLDSSVKGKTLENVRINVGGEWWIEMTPSEGEAWVRRRKTAIIEEHAKILEGWRAEMDKDNSESDKIPAEGFSTTSTVMAEEQTKAESSVTRPRETQAVKAIVSETKPSSSPKSILKEAGTEKGKSHFNQMFKEAEAKGISKGKGKSKEIIPEISSATAKATSKADNSEVKSLASALSQFMESQNALAQATGKNLLPTGNPAEVMINEEGLPIHEIREDENGKLLNDLPVSEAEVEIKVEKEEKEDFWSKEAIARREALRRKVFDDPSDSEDDSEDEIPAREAVSSPSIIATPPTPSTQTTNPISEPTRRTSSSSSTLQPKSILKSSTPRKKSVSFDSSVPVPPDSPGPSTTKIGGSMFPNPVINIETGIQERAVPVLNAPKRSPNRATFEEPFAGFKSGFLGGSTNKGKVDPPSPVNLTSEPGSMEKPAPAEVQSTSKLVEPKPAAQAQAEPKKKSLFAQRQLDPPITQSNPTFPAMSTSTHTSSVKNEIIERPSPAPTPSQAGPSRIPSKDRITGKTAGVASTVTERSEPVPGPSRLTSHLPRNDDLDEGYDDDDDDDSFYADDDDDEYDLDDALLAREVALAYHQNRAYSLLGQQNARSTRSSEDNPEGYDESYVDGYGSEGEEGGVMLGIPQISMLNEGGMPSIVNPTPDDLRRFVRVGKLDNGKLVLAPGEDGWSDEDEGRDIKQERNREEIKAALLGKGGPAVPKVQEKRRGDEAIGMPPVIESAGAMPVQSAVKEKNISSPVVQKEVADPPKKVSRFKAARMG